MNFKSIQFCRKRKRKLFTLFHLKWHLSLNTRSWKEIAFLYERILSEGCPLALRKYTQCNYRFPLPRAFHESFSHFTHLLWIGELIGSNKATLFVHSWHCAYFTYRSRVDSEHLLLADHCARESPSQALD